MNSYDYAEPLLKAIDTVVKERIKDISFDKTETCVIKDISGASSGKYLVSNGSTSFVVYGDRTDYKVNDLVLVTIPQGDYNLQKIILGKRINDKEEKYLQENPFDKVINLTNNIYSNAQASILANSGRRPEPEETPDRTEVPLGDLENAITYTGYNYFALSADFICDIKTAISGEYGVRAEVTFSKGGLNLTLVYYLSSNNFIGNPYKFTDKSGYNQKVVFDISEFAEDYTITDILLYLYQDNKFKDYASQYIPHMTIDAAGDELTLPDNIFVQAPYVFLGYDATSFENNEIILYLDALTPGLEYSSDDTGIKIVNMRWVHEFENGSVGTINSDNTLDGASIEWYKYLRGAPTESTILGPEWVSIDIPAVNEIELPTLFVLSADTNLIASPSDFQLHYASIYIDNNKYRKIINEGTLEERVILDYEIRNRNSEEITTGVYGSCLSGDTQQKSWSEIFSSRFYITPDDQGTAVPNKNLYCYPITFYDKYNIAYLIYHNENNNEIFDSILGEDNIWSLFIENSWSEIIDSNGLKNIIPGVWIDLENEEGEADWDCYPELLRADNWKPATLEDKLLFLNLYNLVKKFYLVLDLLIIKYNNHFSIAFEPSTLYPEEKVRAIVNNGDEHYLSNILTFTNRDKTLQEEDVAYLNCGLYIKPDESNVTDAFYCYDYDHELMTQFKHYRTLSFGFSVGFRDENLGEISPSELSDITWTIPTEYTMLEFIDENGEFLPVGTSTIENNKLYLRIKSLYSLVCYNNTIMCSAKYKGLTYTAIKSFPFGVFSTNGSRYHLGIEAYTWSKVLRQWVSNETSLMVAVSGTTLIQVRDLKLRAVLLDENLHLVDWTLTLGTSITWSWFKDTYSRDTIAANASEVLLLSEIQNSPAERLVSIKSGVTPDLLFNYLGIVQVKLEGWGDYTLCSYGYPIAILRLSDNELLYVNDYLSNLTTSEVNSIRDALMDEFFVEYMTITVDDQIKALVRLAIVGEISISESAVLIQELYFNEDDTDEVRERRKLQIHLYIDKFREFLPGNLLDKIKENIHLEDEYIAKLGHAVEINLIVDDYIAGKDTSTKFAQLKNLLLYEILKNKVDDLEEDLSTLVYGEAISLPDYDIDNKSCAFLSGLTTFKYNVDGSLSGLERIPFLMYCYNYRINNIEAQLLTLRKVLKVSSSYGVGNPTVEKNILIYDSQNVDNEQSYFKVISDIPEIELENSGTRLVLRDTTDTNNLPTVVTFREYDATLESLDSSVIGYKVWESSSENEPNSWTTVTLPLVNNRILDSGTIELVESGVIDIATTAATSSSPTIDSTFRTYTPDDGNTYRQIYSLHLRIEYNSGILPTNFPRLTESLSYQVNFGLLSWVGNVNRYTPGINVGYTTIYRIYADTLGILIYTLLYFDLRDRYIDYDVYIYAVEGSQAGSVTVNSVLFVQRLLSSGEGYKTISAKLWDGTNETKLNDVIVYYKTSDVIDSSLNKFVPSFDTGASCILQFLPFWVDDMPLFGIQYLVGNTVYWTLPIYVYLSDYGMRALDEWDGKELVLDEENSLIISATLAAGKKEDNNTFTGVVIGDLAHQDGVDESLTKHTGVYGLKEGNVVYAFKDDGTAFIGKSGLGRLEFDGNNSTIKNAGYGVENAPGMLFDFNDGYIDITDGSAKVFLSIGRLYTDGYPSLQNVNNLTFNTKPYFWITDNYDPDPNDPTFINELYFGKNENNGLTEFRIKSQKFTLDAWNGISSSEEGGSGSGSTSSGEENESGTSTNDSDTSGISEASPGTPNTGEETPLNPGPGTAVTSSSGHSRLSNVGNSIGQGLYLNSHPDPSNSDYYFRVGKLDSSFLLFDASGAFSGKLTDLDLETKTFKLDAWNITSGGIYLNSNPTYDVNNINDNDYLRIGTVTNGVLQDYIKFGLISNNGTELSIVASSFNLSANNLIITSDNTQENGVYIHKPLLVGSTFSVDWNGKLYATGADISGDITANTGEIGGWTVAANLLSSGSDNGNTSTYVGLSSDDSTDYAIWAGNSIPANASFSVTRTGALTANSGIIGGWEIASNNGGITYTDSEVSLFLNPTGENITIGSDSYSNIVFKAGNNFMVSKTGTLYAGNISAWGGSISSVNISSATINSGTIGGWTIGPDFLSNGSTASTSDTYIKTDGTAFFLNYLYTPLLGVSGNTGSFNINYCDSSGYNSQIATRLWVLSQGYDTITCAYYGTGSASTAVYRLVINGGDPIYLLGANHL